MNSEMNTKYFSVQFDLIFDHQGLITKFTIYTRHQSWLKHHNSSPDSAVIKESQTIHHAAHKAPPTPNECCVLLFKPWSWLDETIARMSEKETL